MDVYGENGEDLFFSEKTLLSLDDVEIISQTVANWLNRYEAGGIKGLHTVKGQGRPPIVRHDNQKAIDKIEELVERHPQKIDQALAEIQEFTGKPMSKRTLQRILKKTAGAGNASGEVWPSGRRPRRSVKPETHSGPCSR